MFTQNVRAWMTAGLLLSVASSALAADPVLAIKAKRIYTMAGKPIDDGVVVIRDGKIAAIGAGVAIPDGAKIIEISDAVVTPGLVDACCMVDDDLPQARGDLFFADGSRQLSHAGSVDQCPACAALHHDHAHDTGAHMGRSGAAALLTSASPADPYGPPPVVEGGVCRICAAAHRYYYLSQAASKSPDAASADAPYCPIHNPAGAKTASWKSFALVASRPPDVEGACGCLCAGPRSQAEYEEMYAPGVSARETWAEHSSEVVPHTYVIDSVNLFASDFKRLLQSGVTTVYVSPDPASVIGARGAIVKTGGELSGRIVRRADAVKAAMGSDPYRRGRNNMLPGRGRSLDAVDVFTRRPTTRMGVEWVFRKAFYDARRYEAGLELSGADTPPIAAIPSLLGILKGNIGLRVQARMQHDILTALRLAQEFNLKITIDEGTEAYLCLPELKASDTPVVYGPLLFNLDRFSTRTAESEETRLSTPRRMLATGVRFCLTAQEMRDEESLVRQAMVATREGLPHDAALAAITATPAALLGIGDQAGTLKAGGAGDLVVWSGDPLDAASKARLVMIGGKVAYQAK